MRFLKSIKTLVVCFIAVGASAFSQINAQEQVEVSDSELNKIASAFQDIQKVNMEAQQKVMQTVEESGFEANRFNEMYQAAASPEKTVDASDPYRHSKWLTFMFKRLLLAKQLLKKNGIIFISIDDNEQPRIRMLCEEVFDEKNFISQIIVQTNKGGRDYLEIANTHEYLLCFGRSEDVKLHKLPKDISSLKYNDSLGIYDIRELRNRNPKFNKENRPNLM